MPLDPRHVAWVLILVVASSGVTYLLTTLYSTHTEATQQSASLDVPNVKVGYINIWGNLTSKEKLFEEIIEPDVNAYAEALGSDMAIDFVVTQASDGGSGALKAVQGLYEEGVKIVIGSNCVACVAYHYINEHGMTLISSWSTQPSFSIPDDRMFRVISPDQTQGGVLAEILESWGVTHVVVMRRDCDWADSVYEAFNTEWMGRGLTELRHVIYQSEETTFRRYLANIEEAITTAASEGVPYERIGVLTLSYLSAAFDESLDVKLNTVVMINAINLDVRK